MENKPDIIATFHREGFDPKQKGRAFWLSCPFHEDKTPSMKIAPDRQSFHCFSCGEGGDVLAFIQKLHGLTFKDALKHLGLAGNRPPTTDPRKQTKRDLLKAFRSWVAARYEQLCRERLCLEALTRDLKTMEEAELVGWAFHELPVIEYHLDLLFYGTDEQKYELYRGVHANGNEE